MKNAKKNSSTFFKKIDLFGKKFNFTIDNQIKFQTNTGIILSLFTFIIIIISIICFGKDFYLRINPKIILETLIPLIHTKYKLTTKNLTIAWRIEDEVGNSLNFTDSLQPNLYFKNFELNPITKNLEKKSSKKIKIIKCNETNVNPNFESIRDASEWYCIDFDSTNFEFGGAWDGSFLNYFNLNINTCEYDDEEKMKKCSNVTKLNDLFNNSIYFSMFYPIAYFVFTDYLEPLKLEYKNYYTLIDKTISKTERMYFYTPSLKDDRGWIFTDNSQQSLLSFKEIEKDFVIKKEEENFVEDSFYSAVFYLDKNFPYYSRSFMKFQDLASIVGGFIKIVTLFFSYVNYHLNKYEKDKYLIDYFFNVSDDNINNLISKPEYKSNKIFKNIFEKNLSCNEIILSNNDQTKKMMNRKFKNEFNQDEIIYNNFVLKSFKMKSLCFDKDKNVDFSNINNNIDDKKLESNQENKNNSNINFIEKTFKNINTENNLSFGKNIHNDNSVILILNFIFKYFLFFLKYIYFVIF